MSGICCYFDIIKNGCFKACSISGRTRRRDYFIFLLTIWGIFIPIFIIVLTSDDDDSDSAGPFVMVIISLCAIICLTIASTIRRLHDAGKTGCYTWLGLFPPFTLILIVFLFYDSERQDNDWGESPKYESHKSIDTSPFIPTSNYRELDAKIEEPEEEPIQVLEPKIYLINPKIELGGYKYAQGNPQYFNQPLIIQSTQQNNNQSSNFFFIGQIPPQ